MGRLSWLNAEAVLSPPKADFLAEDTQRLCQRTQRCHSRNEAGHVVVVGIGKMQPGLRTQA